MANSIIIRETGVPQQIQVRVTELSKGPQGIQGPPGKDGVIQYTAGTGINISAGNVISATGTSTVAWGSITGTLSSQTDLDTALGGKASTTLTGALTDLTTTSKTNLVSAINEADTAADGAASAATAVDTRLTNLFTFTYSNLTATCPQLTPSQVTLKCAKNTDGSLAKIYGRVRFGSGYNGTCVVTTSDTGLRPTTAITISGCAFRIAKTSSGSSIFTGDYTINTDGTVTIDVANASSFTGVDMELIACLLVVKDFGDTPTPE